MYKDIDLGIRKTSNSDINVRENVNAVKQSVENIIMTNVGELSYFPEFGCRLRRFLFEKGNIFIFLAIRDEVVYALRNFEPRIKNIKVEVYEDSNNPNELIIDLSYLIDSIQEVVSQPIVLRVT